MPRSTKPLGLPTRGKTASNRLRRVDNFILLYEPSLLTRTDGLFADSMFLDLGYGFDPRTTLESAERFRRMNSRLKILGVEIDKERVEAALPYADTKTFFRLGGFNVPLQGGEHVRLIRAFNVLRQYEEKDFAPAYETLAQCILPGGLMIEGTSNPFGSIWCANLARRVEAESLIPNSQQQAVGIQTQKWKMEALVFSTNFRLGFEPGDFQTILPKNLIHHVLPGESIYDFFEAWKSSAAEMSSMKTYGAKQWFISTAERMAQRGYEIESQRKWLTKGYLIWKLS
ncbi:MAG: hypothetical protein IPP66_05685 [Anaerolineales bacterium]|nr:hypothetical protein [Anaerolineales bacterium]